MQKALVATAMLMASTATFAADNGIYLGASIGQANADIDLGLQQIDGDDTGFKFIAGLRPLDWFAVEASYVNFGEVESGPLALETDGITAFGVFFAPLGPVDVFAKGGFISSENTIKVRGRDVLSDESTDLAYGAGVQFRLLSLAVRAEYEVFEIDDVDDANFLSIGVTYTFL